MKNCTDRVISLGELISEVFQFYERCYSGDATIAAVAAESTVNEIFYLARHTGEDALQLDQN